MPLPDPPLVSRGAHGAPGWAQTVRDISGYSAVRDISKLLGPIGPMSLSGVVQW